MAGVICPHCDGTFEVFPDAGMDEALAEFDIEKIASVPLAPELAVTSDTGAPVVAEQPGTVVARSFQPLVDAVARLGETDFAAATARTLEDVFEQNLDDPGLQAALDSLPGDQREEIAGEVAALLGQETKRLKGAG